MLRTVPLPSFLVSLLALAACACTVEAKVTPAALFSDHAILQRDKPVAVWGRADPGEKITVTFGGQSATATADAHGDWVLRLSPMAADATPRDLVIRGADE